MFDELRLVAFVAALWSAGAAADAVRCPSLIGELIVGMLLGPHGARLLPDDVARALQVAGQVGLYLMVCEGGLAMELDVLKSQGARATVLALTGTILPVVLGALLMLALGYDATASIASGTALSSTAIGFTLRLMADLKLLATSQGQLITAAAMLDDVFSLVLLAMLQVLVVETSAGAAQTAWLVLRPLLASIGVFVAALVLGAATLRADAWLHELSAPGLDVAVVDTSEVAVHTSDAPTSPKGVDVAAAGAETATAPAAGGAGSSPARRLAAWSTTPPPALGALLAIAVGLAAAAHALHSSALLGCFLAGTIFCSLPRTRDAWAEHVAAPQAWLSRIFFGATVAFTVPLEALVDAAAVGDGLLLTLGAILGKFLSGAWAEPVRVRGGGGGCQRRGFWVAWCQVGCAMIGRGELGFVLAKEALEDGLLPSRAYCATVWALVLATLVGPCAFRLSLRVSARGE